ncbi:MAG: TetR/AcrR family transcriptional regulator [Deltaproteobacteria bacterium]|nr:TetR/AcrR family transcriptional regulator [Deltaproteobacteria bacterium]
MYQKKGELRQQQIFETAASLFAERGYARTSIRDLSEALELSKSSLYHYFDSKEDLLHRLLADFMDEALAQIEEISGRDLPPLEKIGAVMRFYTSFFAGSRHHLTLLVNDLDCLSPVRRDAVVAQERRYVVALKGILSELKDAGLLRDLPLSVAVFAFFGMVHYTPKWYRQDGPVSPADLGLYFQQIFCQGILADDPPATSS